MYLLAASASRVRLETASPGSTVLHIADVVMSDDTPVIVNRPPIAHLGIDEVLSSGWKENTAEDGRAHGVGRERSGGFL